MSWISKWRVHCSKRPSGVTLIRLFAVWYSLGPATCSAPAVTWRCSAELASRSRRCSVNSPALSTWPSAGSCRMPKPLVVLVNGPAAGAGCSLAISGDIVLAAPAAHFTVAYTAIGLTPDGGMSWLLPRLVGLRKAQEMILTNRRVNASEAEAMGLITRVVAEGASDAEGNAIADTLSRSATSALGVVRALLLDSSSEMLEAQLEKEARAITAAGGNAESEEGIAAYSEKRRPNFRRTNLYG